MKNNLRNTLFLILILILSGCESENQPKTKNIILFIGDGMGVAHLYAGMTVSADTFSLEKFPYSGLFKTYSADNYITDSGAAGTAIACGVKTNNGMIGVLPDASPVSSIMEIARNHGLSTGVVSTSAITHATPASFVAHNISRGNYEDIAEDFLNGSIDLFLGGGEDHFRLRKDSIDLTVNLKEQGFDVVYTLEEMTNSKSAKIAGLLAKVHMPKESEGRTDALSEMTRKAIETLSKNEKGFILMIEASMIDWAAHEENLEYMTSEMIDMDKAVGIALEYASANENTLLVVTSDHETGGLTLTGGDFNEHRAEGKFSGSSHTAVMVPTFSFGPGAEKFSGIHENTMFYNTFLDLLNIKK